MSKGLARIIVTFFSGAALLIFFYTLSSKPSPSAPTNSKFVRPKNGGSLKGIDPLLNPEKGPAGHLWGPGEANRTSATLLSLVRNNELEGMISAMRDLERTWNHKFNYPWTFFNDEPFTKEFKERTQKETKAECRYELVPKEHWDVPTWINEDLMKESAALLVENNVQYSSLTSYHQMCRWNSGMFYRHPALKDIRWYWRVEPKVHFFCNVDYDVFRYMEDYNKTYGFVINIYDSPESIETLWPQTLEFLTEHPHYIHPNNALGWLTDAKNRPDKNHKAGGYSTCHFWSNFEIADMNFWRSKVYEDYFEHLDRAGGFFYERWGDAPVHSIALGLFEDKDRIHWFRDIGYQHIPYFNCPSSPKCKGCQAGRFTDGTGLDQEDCRAVWFDQAHMN
ncbi:putative mannosyltransferase ktr4 [Rhizina undulata]